MSEKPPKIPHILFLFSDTGGGHRSAAEAIIESLHLEYGECISAEMVDLIKNYAPRPLNRMPAWYSRIVRVPQLWGLGYHLSDGRRRTRLLIGGALPYVRRPLRQLLLEHPCDLIVSVHPLANTPLLSALGKERPPYISVVTDLVTAHAAWYDRRMDLCLVPSEATRQRALHYGLRPEQVRLVGLPVADRFCHPPGDKKTLRRQLGWPEDLPMVLLVGGGEGMGPLAQTAHAIANANLEIGLAVVTGRNQKLRRQLEAQTWPVPTFIYGFVRDMPDFMAAADILVTKAGPGTISEALNAGLPMVLYSRLPGQEDGNVLYVTGEGAGIWAPESQQIVHALHAWVTYPELRHRAAEACRRIAKPEAARNIARILAEWTGVTV